MAITGTGTQVDPYVVTTYGELVDVAKTSETYTGTYIKIGNDINISQEYPDGDMPTLVINGKIIDGDNKKISNWYKLDGALINFTGASQIHDCEIANLYRLGECINFSGYIADYHFLNCKLHGVVGVLFQAIDDNGSVNNFSRCSFNIKGSGLVANSWSYIGMLNCNIKFHCTQSSGRVFDTSRSTHVRNCYIEANVLPGGGNFDNCVLDVTTTQSISYSGGSGSPSIYNTTHAPNITSDGNHMIGVPDNKWLDVDYLNSVGFNAG